MPKCIPLEICDIILGYLISSEPSHSSTSLLKDASLVCFAWNELTKSRLFRVLTLSLSFDIPKITGKRTASELYQFLCSSPGIASRIQTLRIRNIKNEYEPNGALVQSDHEQLYGALRCLPQLRYLELTDALFASSPHLSIPISLERLVLSMKHQDGFVSDPAHLINVLTMFGDVEHLILDGIVFDAEPPGNFSVCTKPVPHFRPRTLRVDCNKFELGWDSLLPTLYTILYTLHHNQNGHALQSVVLPKAVPRHDMESLVIILKAFAPELNSLSCSVAFRALSNIHADIPRFLNLTSLPIAPFLHLESITLVFTPFPLERAHAPKFSHAAHLISLITQTRQERPSSPFRKVILDLGISEYLLEDPQTLLNSLAELESAILKNKDLEEVICIPSSSTPASNALELENSIRLIPRERDGFSDIEAGTLRLGFKRLVDKNIITFASRNVHKEQAFDFANFTGDGTDR